MTESETVTLSNLIAFASLVSEIWLATDTQAEDYWFVLFNSFLQCFRIWLVKNLVSLYDHGCLRVKNKIHVSIFFSWVQVKQIKDPLMEVSTCKTCFLYDFCFSFDAYCTGHPRARRPLSVAAILHALHGFNTARTRCVPAVRIYLWAMVVPITLWLMHPTFKFEPRREAGGLLMSPPCLRATSLIPLFSISSCFSA